MKIEAANYFPYSELLAGDFFFLKNQEGTFQKINKTSYREDTTKEIINIEPNVDAHRTQIRLAYVRNLF